MRKFLEDLPNLLIKISKISSYAEELLKLKNILIKYNYKELYKAPSWIRFMLTQGIEEPGRYVAQSVSSIAKHVLNVYIDPESYLLYVKQGLPPSVEIRAHETFGIPERLKVLHKLTQLAINIAKEQGIDIPIQHISPTTDDIINDYRKLSILVSNFLNECKDVAVGINDTMSFIFGMRKLTRKYMLKLYPELRDKKLFEELSTTLGLTTVFEPEIADERKRNEYTVIGYPDYAFDFVIDHHGRERRPELHIIGVAEPRMCASDMPGCCHLSHAVEYHEYKPERYVCVEQTRTLGSALCKINDMIWSIFDILSKTLNIPNIGRLYADECKKILAGVSIPDWVKRLGYFTIDKGTIIIEERGAMIGTMVAIRHTRRGLLELLSLTIPLVHLGLCEFILRKDSGFLVWRWEL